MEKEESIKSTKPGMPKSTRMNRTDKLAKEIDVSVVDPAVEYRPMPFADTSRDQSLPVWRVRFDLATDTSKCFGLEINGEVILGRSSKSSDVFDLSVFDAGDLGVSRRHVLLRPTVEKLYVIDLSSTNGTWRNGNPIGMNSPYTLLNGDTLTLGRLQFIVRIMDRPGGGTAALHKKADLADALSQAARAITSALDVEEVLEQIVEVAVSLTNAGEMGIWLVDQQTNELFLEVQQGITDERVRRMRIPVGSDSPAWKVVENGTPYRASRSVGGDQIKLKTDYLVEAVLYVPLTVGGVPIGVLSAIHRESGKSFTERDERILSAISDFAAIAIQNSRQYQATDQALARRVKELASINEMIQSVTASLDLDKRHNILMDELHKQWKVGTTILWLVNEANQTISPYFSAKNGNAPKQTFPLGRGLIGKVAQSGQALYTNDAPTHPEYNAEIDKVTGILIKSVAYAPLLVQEQIVGVLALYNKEDGLFSDEDIKRLQAFANLAATAVQHARLFAESELERETIRATAAILSQPLMILSDDGQVVISNEAAQQLLEKQMAEVFEGISKGIGRTTELALNGKTYITTVEQAPGIGFIVVMQDMTYVKQLERARVEFAQALTHDLKSPLTSIRAWSQLLESHAKLEGPVATFPDRIVKASERMLLMIEQLLDIALLTESPESHYVPCDLVRVVTRAVEDLEGAALAKSITLESKIIGTPYKIKGDEIRLYRSTLNLIDNAIKYSQDNTQVAVELAFGDKHTVIRIRDHGPGIPKEDIPHLFEQYYRGQQMTSDQSGIGLGLTLVGITAESHGGVAAARNIEGGGAEFTITLPASLRSE
ncbi:MAG: GAF domain-containing protein [Anaerolineae bacterium]|nr:GAF domain-containing protein [Anaerolineae bacterium]